MDLRKWSWYYIENSYQIGIYFNQSRWKFLLINLYSWYRTKRIISKHHIFIILFKVIFEFFLANSIVIILDYTIRFSIHSEFTYWYIACSEKEIFRINTACFTWIYVSGVKLQQHCSSHEKTSWILFQVQLRVSLGLGCKWNNFKF